MGDETEGSKRYDDYPKIQRLAGVMTVKDLECDLPLIQTVAILQ